jgi:hypothetical protein
MSRRARLANRLILLCAWILWQAPPVAGGPWRLVDAYETRAECMRYRAGSPERPRSAGQPIEQCLPDSVRPS